MKKVLLVVFLVLAIVFSGCTQSQFDQNVPLPGSDRDSYGCIPSAGYSWCEEKQKCLRSWEEACLAESTVIDTNSPTLESKAREFCGDENSSGVSICGSYIRIEKNFPEKMTIFYSFDFEELSAPIKCPDLPLMEQSNKCLQRLYDEHCTVEKIC